MLKNRDIKRNVYYCLALIMGLFCIFWLIVILKNAGNVPVNQFDGQESHLQNAPTLNVEKTEHSLSGIAETPKEPVDVEGELCSEKCSSARSLVEGDLELDDDTYRKLSASSNEIAAYLANNEVDRRHYLQMALTTKDGDKIGFLTDVFHHLPDEQKNEIVDEYIRSGSVKLRVDAIELITGNSAPDLAGAKKLMEIFSTEENSHVKGTILSSFRRNSKLQVDASLLEQLDTVIYNEADTDMKVAAFKAKTRLIEQPYHIIPDAIKALHSNEPRFQRAGIVAISNALEHEKSSVENGGNINLNTIRNEIQTIRNLSVNEDENTEDVDRLIQEAGKIYSRYFDD